jgi:hypothetical protein
MLKAPLLVRLFAVPRVATIISSRVSKTLTREKSQQVMANIFYGKRMARMATVIQ